MSRTVRLDGGRMTLPLSTELYKFIAEEATNNAVSMSEMVRAFLRSSPEFKQFIKKNAKPDGPEPLTPHEKFLQTLPLMPRGGTGDWSQEYYDEAARLRATGRIK